VELVFCPALVFTGCDGEWGEHKRFDALRWPHPMHVIVFNAGDSTGEREIPEEDLRHLKAAGLIY